MTIAVLDYNKSKVDIIENAPDMNNDEADAFLSCNYNLDEIFYLLHFNDTLEVEHRDYSELNQSE